MPDHRADRDNARSRRLLFSPELADGSVRWSQLARFEARTAARGRRIPSPLSRRLQRSLMRKGSLGYKGETVARAMAARRAVLGDAAPGPPRLLLRAGSFPHPLTDDDPARYGPERFRRFQAQAADAGLHYLVAVTPRVSRRPLDPGAHGDRPLADDELELLAQLRRDGVAFAAHGLDHRTRRRAAGGRSELAGLRGAKLTEHLERADAELAAAAIRPEVFVPPFDRFDWRQWDALAARYTVVAAGDASLDTMGFHDAPLWRGDAVWLPAYAPFDGPAPGVLAATRALDEDGAALWVPAAIDWSAELDDADALAGLARWSTDWDAFLDAVRASERVDAATQDRS